MDKFVDYKEVPIGDEAVWKIKYEPVWADEGIVMDCRPKVTTYARDGMAEVVFADVDVNYKIKVDEAGYVYIDYNRCSPFESTKPVEKRGLYDLYIDNHIDIPESISKESPCYKQFMKEKENVE